MDLDVVNLNVGKYPQLDSGEYISTIGTWAMLVTLSKTLENLSSIENISLPDFIARNISPIDDENSKSNFIYCNADQFFVINEDNELKFEHKHIGPSLFFRGLPISNNLADLFGVQTVFNFPNIIILLAVLLAIIILFYLLGKTDVQLFWKRRKHFIYGAIFYIIVYFIISRLIYYSEYHLYTSYAIKSPVLNLSFIEFHKWLLFAVLTNYYSSGIFPMSTFGQIGVSIIFYLIWITGIFLILFEIIKRNRHQKRLKGMKKVNYTNHFVVCGWNDSAADFIIKSKSALKKYIIHNSNKIVVLNDYLREHFDDNEQLKKLHEKKQFEYIHGDAKDENYLEKTNISKAKTIVLLADNHSIDADEKTLLRALAIERYCKEISHTIMDENYIIAEINNNNIKKSLYAADVNEVVCTVETGQNILIQSMINHGISDVVDTILSYNEHNEFYTIDLREKEKKRFVGKSFDELLIELRKHNILLIGIKSRHFDKHGKEIIDKDELRKLDKKEFKIERNIIVNPHTQDENNYRTDDDDELIVLAVNERIVTDLS